MTLCMRTLMEKGQMEKLTLGHGNYLNNYKPEVLMKGILRQVILSATQSGMHMHAPQNHTILRFKQLVWYDLPELHDDIFHIHWDFPNAWEEHSLHPLHFLSTSEASRCNNNFNHKAWP